MDDDGGEDPGGLAGWSLNDKSRHNDGFGWQPTGGVNSKTSLKIAVHGHQLPNPIESASVDDATLTLEFNKDLDPGSLPAPGAFLVTVDDRRVRVAEGGVGNVGGPNGVNGLRVLPRRLLLTLASEVAPGQTVKVRYDKPDSNPLKDTDDNEITPFNNYPVTNDSQPKLLNAGIRPSDRTQLRLVFDEPLDPEAEPAGSAFSVTVGGSARTLASGDPVAMDGNLVTLTLSSAAATGQAVTVGYTKPSAATRLKDALGNEADAFSGQTVKIDNSAAPASSQGDQEINAPEQTLVSLDFNWTQFTDADGDPLTLSWRANRYDVFDSDTPNLNAAIGRVFVFHADNCVLMNLDPPAVPGDHNAVLTMTAADPYGESASVDLNYLMTGGADVCPRLTGTPGVRGAVLALVYYASNPRTAQGLLASDFTVRVDGTAVTPTAVSIGAPTNSGDTRTTPVTLMLPQRVRPGQTVTVSHAVPISPGTVGFADVAVDWTGRPPTAVPASAGDLTQAAPPGERREVGFTFADPDIAAADLVVIPSGGTTTDAENTLTVTVASPDRPEALAEAGYDADAGKAFLKVKDAAGLCGVSPRLPATFTTTVTVTATDVDGETASKDIVATTTWSESACGPTLAARAGARPYVDGGTLTLTFNQALDETAGARPAAGDFSVTVDGAARTVTGVNVSGSKVVLTLASPTAEGESVTVDYTAGTNRLRFADGTGEPGQSFSGQAVANFTGEVPALSSATVNGGTLTLTYDEALDEASVPAAGDFTVTVDGAAWTVDGVDVDGSAVELTLDPAVSAGEAVTVGYEAGTNPIRGALAHDAVRFDAADFSGRAVVNESPDIRAPQRQAATVQGTALTLTYGEPLDQGDGVRPPTSYFAVTVDGETRNVLAVEVGGHRVTLTIAEPAVGPSQSVGVRYIGPPPGDPSGRGIQDLAGNQAPAFGPVGAAHGPPPSVTPPSTGRPPSGGGGGGGGTQPPDPEPPANAAPETAAEIEDAMLRVGAALEIDLSDAFHDEDDDELEYAAESSDPGIAAAELDGDRLTVRAVGPGTAEIATSAEDPDGEKARQTFEVTVRWPETVWYLPPASDPARQGFVRVINHSDAAGEATLTATDDAGVAYESLALALGPRQARHFNSDDLELGNAAKGLTGATGPGAGGWRLAVESDRIDVEALAYARAADGFVTAMNAVAPREDGALRVFTFNPGSNVDQTSLLRLVNPSDEDAEATVTGVDDAGLSPGEPVVLELPAGSACTVDAAQLESGAGLACGSPQAGLGDGAGKWRLTVASDAPLTAMSLLSSPQGAPDEPVREGGQLRGRGLLLVRGPLPGGVGPARAAGVRAHGEPLGARPRGDYPGLRRFEHGLRAAAAARRRQRGGALQLRRPGARQPREGPDGQHRVRQGHVAADVVLGRGARGGRLRAHARRVPDPHAGARAAARPGAPGGVPESGQQHEPGRRAAPGEPVVARRGGDGRRHGRPGAAPRRHRAAAGAGVRRGGADGGRAGVGRARRDRVRRARRRQRQVAAAGARPGGGAEPAVEPRRAPDEPLGRRPRPRARGAAGGALAGAGDGDARESGRRRAARPLERRRRRALRRRGRAGRRGRRGPLAVLRAQHDHVVPLDAPLARPVRHPRAVRERGPPGRPVADLGRGRDRLRAAVPRMRTWLLTGVPRAGTSLCCRLAGGLPRTVALSEPIPPRAFDAARCPAAACGVIRAFADAVRAGLLADGRAPSVQVDGRLADGRVADVPGPDGLRAPVGGPGEIAAGGRLDPDFTLLVNHNALFAALLEPLAAAFPVLALVRNPVAVLASWATVDLPARRGRAPMAERFDADLARALDAAPVVLWRRAVLVEWFFARFAAHVPAERILRYEDVVAGGGRPLFRALGVPDAPPEPLGNRNANVLYGAAGTDAALALLLSGNGAWREFYAPADLMAAARRDPRGRAMTRTVWFRRSWLLGTAGACCGRRPEIELTRDNETLILGTAVLGGEAV